MLGHSRGIALVLAHSGPVRMKQDRDKTSASATPASPTCVKVAINCKRDIHATLHTWKTVRINDKTEGRFKPSMYIRFI
jgi:hypothetical protein